MTHVGVVFGTYNRLEHLKRAVASVIQAGTGVDVSMFIVDGGSTDGSRNWLLKQRLSPIFQEGPLTGAVRAFNLGFTKAVEEGCDYVFHFNDDAEIVTPGAFAQAVAIMETDAKVGEVAFEFDLRGGWNFDEIDGRVYANFGMIRTSAGIAAAKAYGDMTGMNWWNPIYRTYGADCEFGFWLWKLGYTVHRGVGLRVHDCQASDVLRDLNESNNPNRKDSALFWSRFPELFGGLPSLNKPPVQPPPPFQHPPSTNGSWNGRDVPAGVHPASPDGVPPGFRDTRRGIP